MARRRRVYDQLKRQFVSSWLGRKEARMVRNTVALLHPEERYVTPEGGVRIWNPRLGPRFICTSAKRKK